MPFSIVSAHGMHSQICYFQCDGVREIKTLYQIHSCGSFVQRPNVHMQILIIHVYRQELRKVNIFR